MFHRSLAPAALIVFVTILGGCSDVSDEDPSNGCSPSGEGTYRICLMKTGDGATGTMWADGRTIEGLFGGSEWEIGGAVAHGDPAVPAKSDLTFVRLFPGDQMVVDGDANRAEATITPVEADSEGYLTFDVGRPLTFADGAFEVDAGPGRYMLTVTGHWNEGIQTFWFGVRVDE